MHTIYNLGMRNLREAEPPHAVHTKFVSMNQHDKLTCTCMVPWPIWKRGGSIYIKEEHMLPHAISRLITAKAGKRHLPSQVAEPDDHGKYNSTFQVAACISTCPSKVDSNSWEDTSRGQHGTSIPRTSGLLSVQHDVPDERNKRAADYDRSTDLVFIGVYAD